MIFNTWHLLGVGLLCVWKAAGRGAKPLTKKYLKKIIDWQGRGEAALPIFLVWGKAPRGCGPATAFMGVQGRRKPLRGARATILCWNALY